MLRTRLIAVLASLALLGAACSSGGSDDGQPEPPPDNGGLLRMALERPDTLDPARADRGLQHEAILADLLFDGLTALGRDGDEPVPAVAASWTPEDGMKAWTFKLADRTFHDGRAITAADVKASLERVAKRGTASAASVQLELVSGYRKFAVDGTADGLKGITASDDATVRIALDLPSPNFPLLMSNPVYGIVPADADQPKEPSFAEEPVGSGPLRITGRVAEGDVATELRLRPADGVDLAIDGVDVVLVESATAGYERFVAGAVDVARVPTDKVGEAAAAHGTEAYGPYVAELFYAFNLSDPLFAQRGFREAIVRAVDRQAIVTDVYGDTVDLLSSMVPDGVEGHRDDACGRCAYDVGRSEDLLDDLFGDGEVPTVAIDFDAGDPQDQVAAAIASDLDAVGIPTQLRPRPFEGDDNYQDFIAGGKAQLFRLGWIGSMPSPQVFLVPLFETDSPDNVTGFSDGTVDALFEEARSTRDADDRRKLLAEAEDAILAEVPVLPIAQFRTHLVVSSIVRGLTPNVMGTFDIGAVFLEPAEG